MFIRNINMLINKIYILFIYSLFTIVFCLSMLICYFLSLSIFLFLYLFILLSILFLLKIYINNLYITFILYNVCYQNLKIKLLSSLWSNIFCDKYDQFNIFN
ncbi:SWPV1-266 [Shearwaterpox virus]|uniref:SWPV1-266 n=1 Tax=Shearwaterpox virus TaxID=1974596 RepID=A0A1V0S873_CNPV|nr:SWPV1-266 [Shearwaterpox virus]